VSVRIDKTPTIFNNAHRKPLENHKKSSMYATIILLNTGRFRNKATTCVIMHPLMSIVNTNVCNSPGALLS